MNKAKPVTIIMSATLFCACSSSSATIDRSALHVSDNSRVVAANVIPSSSQYPTLVDHLGLAQEVYQTQIKLLKERRESLRSRTRMLRALSYGTLALTSVGVGVTAIASRDSENADRNLQAAGYGALGGVAAGTMFQFAGYMQEDPSAINGKIERLETAYISMVDRVRGLAERGVLEPNEQRIVGAEMAGAIEGFMAQALQIDVKG